MLTSQNAIKSADRAPCQASWSICAMPNPGRMRSTFTIFSNSSIIPPSRLQASIGVTRSYSSRLFLCALDTIRIQLSILGGLQASIGVTHSYSSRPFLCAPALNDYHSKKLPVNRCSNLIVQIANGHQYLVAIDYLSWQMIIICSQSCKYSPCGCYSDIILVIIWFLRCEQGRTGAIRKLLTFKLCVYMFRRAVS